MSLVLATDRAFVDPEWSLSQLGAHLLAGAQAADWVVQSEKPWCRVFPIGHVPRRQGWKLHLSATPASAVDLLERAVPVLVSHRCAAKFPADLGWAAWLNSPRCPRGTAGKFLTAYPENDEHFVRVADALDHATAGLVGPQILSDRRLRPGSVVYYRFGGFTGEKALDDDGRYRQVVVDPAGRVVEDRREAWFAPPPWAVPVLPYPPPDLPAVADAVLLGDRYVIRTAIRHSSRGGVYLGTDQLTGTAVVVKQARAHMDQDPSGRDCRVRLRHEAELLRRLAPQGLAPRLTAVVAEADDLYLVRDAVEGTTLRRWVLRHLHGGGASREEGLVMARSLVQLVAAAHQAGLVLVDVSPNNIMVDTRGKLWLTDLDHAARPGEVIYPVGTPGYKPPEHLVANRGVVARPEADLFGLGGLLFLIAVGTDPALAADDPPDRSVQDRLRAWLDAGDAEAPLAKRLTEAVIGLTDDRPRARWYPHRVLGLLDRVDPVALRRSRRPPRSHLRLTVDRLIDDGVAELLARMDPRGERLWPASRSGASADPCAVQHGAAGVLATLVRAAPEASEPARIHAAVEAACRWLEQRVPAEPRLLPGLYFGRAGTAWAMHEAAELLDDRQVAAGAIELALRVPVEWDNPDVAHGAAGAGMTLLHLWRATGDQRLPARIRACADGLVAAATDTVNGPVAWPIPSTLNSVLAGRTFYGYDHGTAGVAAFLLSAGQETGQPGYLRLAEQAATALTTAARRYDGMAFWPVGPHAEPAGDAGWCKGSAGIGTFLLRAWQVTGDRRCLDLARGAAFAVHRSRLRATTDACHGLAGGGHFLLDLADALDDEAFRGRAWDLARVLAARSARRDGRLLVPDETGQDVTADYGVGSAGILGFLLRLRFGGSRPWTVDTHSSVPGSRVRCDTTNQGGNAP